MIRFAPIAAVALCLSAATPALAQSGHYTATPTEAPKKASFITQTTVWKCKDGTCAAPKSTMSDKVMCERVVQRVGALTTFTVGGTSFDAETLAACNARAK
ncbi:hypothetical protein [Sphingomonas sp.]|uniref:CC_3452 family protein n=1 Tax=Sphingomonas sp. TaxID=28214 RepID=UPI000BDC94D6|nr:hypothetical protein [Sphingomonas sp.]MBA4763077.1 hypothetical protein [Sphingomonas sp.]OYX52246.1 MAG: hypothetical protein B7Y97_02185 [Sphingomonas sp. 32-66-10]